MVDVLYYNELDRSGLTNQIDSAVGNLRIGNFRAAKVKKLVGTPYYRAKLDQRNRLLFQFANYREKRMLLVLDVIRNHAYDRCRFLRGIKFDETKLEQAKDASPVGLGEDSRIKFVNFEHPHVHVLDKVISLDKRQLAIYSSPLPLFIIGPAGSGKTAVTLEKVKQLEGDVLYITRSRYLAENSREEYFSLGYDNEAQNVEFLSYEEFLHSIAIPDTREASYKHFVSWFQRQSRGRQLRVKDAHRIYEEFKGVLTGSEVSDAWLSYEKYTSLGVRQSIFLGNERPDIYELFERYLSHLKESNLHDGNILAHKYHEFVETKYDAVVIDEAQDLTNIELSLILRSLRKTANFLLCGDSNQLVHPNFFSWSKLRSLFFHDSALSDGREVIGLLSTNYRSSDSIINLANRILKTKHSRFGSIDKLSNYLVDAVGDGDGKVEFVDGKSKQLSELNKRTQRSTRFAVVVMRDEDKENAAKTFDTPLLFSVREAKGLEYDNIILYNIISSADKLFQEIAASVSRQDLEKSELDYSRSGDKTDKSLEVYKFYINSLYVAVTRAIRNLYVVENNTKHGLLQLLDIKQQKSLSVEQDESTLEDWQREAYRLRQQGKLDQAEAILKDILHTKPVPWKTLCQEALVDFKNRACNRRFNDRNAQRVSLGYTFAHADFGLQQLLGDAGSALAGEQASKIYEVIRKRFYSEFSAGTSSDLGELKSNVNEYGLEYKNRLGQSPLMAAATIGDVEAIKYLIDIGADRNSRDFFGLNAYQISLRQCMTMEYFHSEYLDKISACLVPPSLNIKVDNRLIKLDKRQIEFFLANIVLPITQGNLRNNGAWDSYAFTAKDLEENLRGMPESVLPIFRKRRQYISGVLSKNEIDRDSPYNRKLFRRTKRGCYVINPDLEIQCGGEWKNIYDLANLDLMKQLAPGNQRLSIDRLLLLLQEPARKHVGLPKEHQSELSTNNMKSKRDSHDQDARKKTQDLSGWWKSVSRSLGKRDQYNRLVGKPLV